MRTALAFADDPYEQLRRDAAEVREQYSALLASLRAEDTSIT